MNLTNVTVESVLAQAAKLAGSGMGEVRQMDPQIGKLIDLSVVTGASAMLLEMVDAGVFTPGSQQMEAVISLLKGLAERSSTISGAL